MEKYLDNYAEWCNCPIVDQQTKNELNGISQDDKEIRERFSNYLSFGTAGLRGIMQAGINAMNKYTVAHTTQALANLINELGMANRGVIITHDSRNNSRLFAETSACVLAASGIKVYLFEDLRPTPELSFGIRYLKCIAGINITASHNPKQYNGYKAYWEDGAQLSEQLAQSIASKMAEIDIFNDVKSTDLNTAISNKTIEIIGKEIDDAYCEEVLKERVDPELIKRNSDTLKIVYTPLHGTGSTLVPKVLKAAGVKNLIEVKEQFEPDGDFPTTVKPNPEYPEVFTLGEEYAKKENADLIIATDPDADRMGVTIMGDDNQFMTLTGNQIGSLLIDYIASSNEKNNTVPQNPYVVKSIVSTELATKICENHNIQMYNVLTGFKYIGEVIEQKEGCDNAHFILGFEESYGYLKGTYARDKDAVIASLLVCEMAAFHAEHGRTLYDALQSLYQKYGYYKEGIDEVYFEGLDGISKMQSIMDSLRNNIPLELANEKIKAVKDYKTQIITDIDTKETTPTGLPSSNVLCFVSENDNLTIVRPSGTEPKIKFYYLVHSDSEEKANETVKSLSLQMKSLTV